MTLKDIFILFNATPTELGRLAYTSDIPGIHLWSWDTWLSPAAQNSVFECPLLRRLKDGYYVCNGRKAELILHD